MVRAPFPGGLQSYLKLTRRKPNARAPDETIGEVAIETEVRVRSRQLSLENQAEGAWCVCVCVCGRVAVATVFNSRRFVRSFASSRDILIANARRHG
jgi:hypothetical protein